MSSSACARRSPVAVPISIGCSRRRGGRGDVSVVARRIRYVKLGKGRDRRHDCGVGQVTVAAKRRGPQSSADSWYVAPQRDQGAAQFTKGGLGLPPVAPVLERRPLGQQLVCDRNEVTGEKPVALLDIYNRLDHLVRRARSLTAAKLFERLVPATARATPPRAKVVRDDAGLAGLPKTQAWRQATGARSHRDKRLWFCCRVRRETPVQCGSCPSPHPAASW